MLFKNLIILSVNYLLNHLLNACCRMTNISGLTFFIRNWCIFFSNITILANFACLIKGVLFSVLYILKGLGCRLLIKFFSIMMNSRFGMFLSKWNLYLYFVVFIVAFGACSSFEKILKSKDYEYKYKKALEYYANKDHYRYLTLFEQLSPVYKGTMRSDTIEFYLAEGNYHQGDYLLAAHYYDKFRKTFPRSVFTEDADYMYAYCYYMSSPRAELDQENTQLAMAAFADFLTRYPKTKHLSEVNKIMTELRDKLIEKSYLSSKLYFKIGDYKAAIVAIRNSLKEFPNSKYREEQMFLILKSSYLLADNSVLDKQRERFQSAVDEYYTFVGEFPESKYVNEAKKMYEASMGMLKKLN